MSSYLAVLSASQDVGFYPRSMEGFNEIKQRKTDINEYLTELDEARKVSEEHVRDAELAAEIGQMLLVQNKQLEENILELQDTIRERDLKIEQLELAPT